MNANGWLNEDELTGLEFLHVLESYYPLEEYDQTQAHHRLAGQRGGVAN